MSISAPLPCQPGNRLIVDRLNALLRGEITAVETSMQVISAFGVASPYELGICLHSHEVRVEKLTVRVADLGGTPATSCGFGGTIAKLVESSAGWLGLKSALRTLEDGEDQAVVRYRERLADPQMDEQSRHLIRAELFPEQLKTDYLVHDLCSAI